MFQFPTFALYNYEFIAQLMSFLIRKSRDRRFVASYPEPFVGSHVLLRFCNPRHPPYTLSNLITSIDHPLTRACPQAASRL